MEKVAVIGAGNAGCAVSAHFKQLGCEVSLYDVEESQLSPIWETGNTVAVTGTSELTGEFAIDQVTMDLAEAIKGARLLVCVTPAHVHKQVARDLARRLEPGQILLLQPGRTGGVLEVHQVLAEEGFDAEVLVIEAQTVLYACRREGATVNIYGVKAEVPCAGLSAADDRPFFDFIRPLMPQFVRAQSIWHTSLNNIGMLFHPSPTLLNLGRMESGQPFEYYIEGMSPSISYLVEKLDRERLAVASALDVELPSALEWLSMSYGADGGDLHEALRNNDSYQGIMAPMFDSIEDKLGLRYVIEDVPTGLVPTSELGRRCGVETPTIDTMIALASALYETDFRATGRNMSQLGIADMSREELIGL